MIIAKYIMFRHRRTFITPDTTGKEIVYRLMATGFPGLPVVNEKMEIMGIVTEFDILGNIREGKSLDEITAGEIMSKEPMTTDIDTPAEYLIEMMLENNLTIIPVLKDRKFVGVVDRHSLIDVYVEPHLNRYTEKGSSLPTRPGFKKE
ncbi:MAG: CBS domain-containing protein [Nitrospirae bacterium]|nr:CBS domain-containing protein [Nitrospirota bacterium]